MVNARLSEAVAPHGLALRARPLQPDRLHHRRQRGRERRRAALPQVRRHHQPHPRARGGAARRRDRRARRADAGEPWGSDLSGSSSAAKGCSAIATDDHRAPRAAPARRAHPARRLHDRRAASEAVSAIIAAGHRARRARDDGPGLRRAPSKRRSTPRLSDRRRRRAAGRAGRRRPTRSRPRRSRSRTILLSTAPARCAGAATPPTRRLWQGRKKAFGAMGRIAPDLAVQDAVVPRSALPDDPGQIDAIAPALRPHHQQRLPRGRWQSPSRTSASTGAIRRVAARVHQRCREIMEACVGAGGSITGEHGVGIDKLDYMPWIFDPQTLGAMRAVRRVFDPTERANPGKVFPVHACREWRAVKSARQVRMSDASLPASAHCSAPPGWSGIANGMPGPRPIPPTRYPGLPAGPRGELEDPGRRPEAPGCRPMRPPISRVSTRALEQIVSVSPADLVATVQAGASLEALRRRLADYGMWLAIDPPGRPERSIGSVVATATAGPLRHGFGPVRDHVLGCSVATGDGRLVNAGGRVVKNVAGYDLTKLQVGGFGGFGMIAEVHLRLRALPRADVTLVARGARDVLTSAAREMVAPHLLPGGPRAALARPCGGGRMGAGRAVCRHRRGRPADVPGSGSGGRSSWQPLPADRTAAFWSVAARALLGGPVTLRLGVLADGLDETLDLLAHDLDEGLDRRRRGLGMLRWTGEATVERLRAVRRTTAAREIPMTIERAPWAIRHARRALRRLSRRRGPPGGPPARHVRPAALAPRGTRGQRREQCRRHRRSCRWRLSAPRATRRSTPASTAVSAFPPAPPTSPPAMKPTAPRPHRAHARPRARRARRRRSRPW